MVVYIVCKRVNVMTMATWWHGFLQPRQARLGEDIPERGHTKARPAKGAKNRVWPFIDRLALDVPLALTLI